MESYLVATTPQVSENISKMTAEPYSQLQDPDNVMGQLGGSIAIVLIAVGIMGNIQVIILVALCPRLHRSYNALIASLSFTDLLFNSTIMPFYADSYIHRGWRFSVEMCQFHTYFGAMLLLSSAFHIALIAVNRYVLIVHGQLYTRYSSRCAVLGQIAVVWSVSFLTVLPNILGWNADVGYSDQVARCNYVREKCRLSLSAMFTFGYVVPCAIMIWCYAMIWRAIKTRQRKLSSHLIGEIPSRGGGGLPLARCSQELLWQQLTSELERRPSNLSSNGGNGEVSIFQDKTCLERIIDDPRENENNSVSGPPDESRILMAGNNEKTADIVSLRVVSQSPPSEVVFVSNNLVGTYPKRIDLRSNNSASGKRDYLSVKTTDVFRGRSKHAMRVDVVSTNGTDFSVFTSSSSIDVTRNDVMKLPYTNNHSIQTSALLKDMSCCGSLYSFCCGKDPKQSIVTRPASTVEGLSLPDNPLYPLTPDTCHPKGFAGTVMRRRSMLNSSVRTMVVIFIAFFITYLPFVIVNLVEGVEPNINRNWYIMTSLSFWCGSCVNPIIYGIMNKQFRVAYVNALVALHRRNCRRRI